MAGGGRKEGRRRERQSEPDVPGPCAVAGAVIRAGKGSEKTGIRSGQGGALSRRFKRI